MIAIAKECGYRAALAEWRREADPLPQRPPRWHPRAAAVALAAVVVAIVLIRVLWPDMKSHADEVLVPHPDLDAPTPTTVD